MNEPWSFDAQAAPAAAPAAGGAVPAELPGNLQRHGVLWPTPADMVSDHSAEGAPWQPTARDIPHDPPTGPPWTADHDGPAVPATANDWQSQPPAPNHEGSGAALPAPNGAPFIGAPFTVDQGSHEIRHLATDQWDPTGKRVSPPDAPSAPHQLFGSQHDTRPRQVPAAWGALFANVAASNQFTANPGYLGVNAAMPDMSQRPAGAVAAQPPADPYVAAQPGQQAPAAVIDYGTDW